MDMISLVFMEKDAAKIVEPGVTAAAVIERFFA